MNALNHTFAVIALLAAGSAEAAVLVVDSSGGGNHLQISAAVLAAANGDTILVRSGDYAPFVIDAKDLDVVADTGAVVNVHGGIVVRNTAAAQVVVLAGLRCYGLNTGLLTIREALRVESAAGPVRVLHSLLRGENGISYVAPMHGADGAWVQASSDVAFQACVIVGGSGMMSFTGFSANRGGDGLHVESATAAVHGSTVVGGDGGQGDFLGCDLGGDGGHGARVLGGTLFAGGSSILGGDGGGDGFLACRPGGDGIRLTGATSHADLLDDVLTGGKGACGAPDGIPLALEGAASATHYTGLARPFHVTSPVREQATATLTFTGTPGDVAVLLASLGTAAQATPVWKGVLHPSLPFAAPPIVAGVLPAAGALVLSFPVPLLPAGVDVTVLHLQSLHASTLGDVVLGMPEATVILDSSF